jgi:hypothetical protein
MIKFDVFSWLVREDKYLVLIDETGQPIPGTEQQIRKNPIIPAWIDVKKVRQIGIAESETDKLLWLSENFHLAKGESIQLIKERRESPIKRVVTHEEDTVSLPEVKHHFEAGEIVIFMSSDGDGIYKLSNVGEVNRKSYAFVHILGENWANGSNHNITALVTEASDFGKILVFQNAEIYVEWLHEYYIGK